jgi:MFS family permease
MFKLDARHIVTYMLLGLGFADVMGFMYMQYVYYDALVETLGITNTQLGFLITLLGITAVVTSVPCGIIVDRVDCRKALAYSLAGMMLFCALFAIIPTYAIACVTWVVAGIIMSVWYSAIYKVVRVIAPPEAIGKSFGIFGVGVAVGSIIVNIAGLALYDALATNYGLSVGLSSILWAFFIAGMISAIGGYLLTMHMPIQGEASTTERSKRERFSLSEAIAAFKDIGTWLYVLGCFCIYSFQISISYFTPYFTAVLGTTLAFSGVVAVFRQYGLRIISAPLGGWLGDKLGGTAKVIRVSMAILAILVLIVLLLPPATPLAVLVVIVFVLGLLGTMNISLQASISGDALVPPKNMGLVVGMTGMLSADLFQPTLFGSWLDAYGNAGYTYIWIYTLVTIAAAITILSLMIARKKRLLAATAESTTDGMSPAAAATAASE